MKNFKNRAIELQEQYIKGKTVFDQYCILKDDDALKYQFVKWEGLIEEITYRRKIYNKQGKVKAAYKNMLRSEHIPYNFFIPLKLSKDRDRCLRFFNEFLKRKDIIEVISLDVEWAPKNPLQALNDKSSFDTYIKFKLGNNKMLGVGIEVKFTEKSYPYTATELKRLKTQKDSSPYFKVWNNKNISVYKTDSFEKLGEKGLKQFFRNHLLGLTLLDTPNSKERVDEFVSVHLFPSENYCQRDKAKEYQHQLMPEKQNTFLPITFEDFIDNCKRFFSDVEHISWLDYLEKRYVVKKNYPYFVTNYQ